MKQFSIPWLGRFHLDTTIEEKSLQHKYHHAIFIIMRKNVYKIRRSKRKYSMTVEIKGGWVEEKYFLNFKELFEVILPLLLFMMWFNILLAGRRWTVMGWVNCEIEITLETMRALNGECFFNIFYDRIFYKFIFHFVKFLKESSKIKSPEIKKSCKFLNSAIFLDFQIFY